MWWHRGNKGGGKGLGAVGTTCAPPSPPFLQRSAMLALQAL